MMITTTTADGDGKALVPAIARGGVVIQGWDGHPGKAGGKPRRTSQISQTTFLGFMIPSTRWTPEQRFDLDQVTCVEAVGLARRSTSASGQHQKVRRRPHIAGGGA